MREEMAPPAVEPPPPPRRGVADRAGTLQGQLRALSARVLLLQQQQQQRHAPSSSWSSRRRARATSSSSSSYDDDDHHAAAAAAVTRLQRRAFEVLLRLDKDVRVAEWMPSSVAERHESNALKLGAVLYAMRTRGDAAAADLLEGLNDAFVSRRTAFLPATPFTDAGPLPQLHDYDAILADAEAGVKTRHGFEYDAPPHAPYREDHATGLREHTSTL